MVNEYDSAMMSHSPADNAKKSRSRHPGRTGLTAERAPCNETLGLFSIRRYEQDAFRRPGLAAYTPSIIRSDLEK